MFSFWEDIIKLFLSAVIVGIIGINREKMKKAAGIRTNIIVAVASCLIMILSTEVSRKSGADPGRVAAQVVSGIGFLGAGTIIKHEDKVEGLTTAASLWGVAGIGMAVGYACYKIAITAAILIALSLFIPTAKLNKTNSLEDKDSETNYNSCL